MRTSHLRRIRWDVWARGRMCRPDFATAAAIACALRFGAFLVVDRGSRSSRGWSGLWSTFGGRGLSVSVAGWVRSSLPLACGCGGGHLGRGWGIDGWLLLLFCILAGRAVHHHLLRILWIWCVTVRGRGVGGGLHGVILGGCKVVVIHWQVVWLSWGMS